MNNLNSPTKDEILLMPNKIDSILNRLGFNLCLRGYIYYRDLILFSLNFNLDEIRLIDLYALISQKYNKPISIIKKNIENIFSRFDLQKFELNFKSEFNIDFDYIYTTPKNLLILIINKEVLRK